MRFPALGLCYYKMPLSQRHCKNKLGKHGENIWLKMDPRCIIQHLCLIMSGMRIRKLTLLQLDYDVNAKHFKMCYWV